MRSPKGSKRGKQGIPIWGAQTRIQGVTGPHGGLCFRNSKTRQHPILRRNRRRRREGSWLWASGSPPSNVPSPTPGKDPQLQAA